MALHLESTAVMRYVAALGLLLAMGVTGPACSAVGPVGPSAKTGTTDVAKELAFCADETNRYRAGIGLPPLQRSSALEEFAEKAAEHDAQARVAHQLFALTNGGNVSRAETEVLWWKSFDVRSVVERGLSQMWRQGPGGEHRDIMAGTYTHIGCGFYIDRGEVTVTQDFR